MTKVRRWPALAIVAAAILWIAVTWLTGDAIRQDRTIMTIATLALALAALTAWLAFFSRAPRRVRWTGTALVIGSLALIPALFRVRGVTGDFVPVLEPRWSGERELPAPAAPAEAAGAAPAAGEARVPESETAGGGEPPRPEPDAQAAAPEAPAETPAPETAVGAYPQFLGPNRDAVLPGPRLARDWSANPPRRLWRQPIGEGWSGFALSGRYAITQEQRGDEEHVVAYDGATGRPLWSHADEARYDTVIAGVGPRATPTIHGDRVFTMGATGILNALDLRTGRRLWSRQVVTENGGRLPEWGKSASPLVEGGHVVVSAGGADGRSLVAYDARSGEPVWAAGSGHSSYSSPVLATLAGRRQIVILNGASVAGHDPESGALLWEHPFPGGQPNVTNPLPLPGDRLLVSVGYGIGSKAYRLGGGEDGLEASLLWESPRLKSKFANLIWRDGSVYGLDDGVLTCLDPATGERRWKAGRYGHGQLLLVGDVLLVQTEDGEVVLVRPSSEAHRELTRFPALEGKTWNPPALAGRLLVVRNDREAAAYELPVE